MDPSIFKKIVATVGGRTADFNLPGVSTVDDIATKNNVTGLYVFVKKDAEANTFHENVNQEKPDGRASNYEGLSASAASILS